MTLIQHVTVINVVTGEEAKEQTVKRQGGRILSVAPTESADGASPGAVDGHGGFLIPAYGTCMSTSMERASCPCTLRMA